MPARTLLAIGAAAAVAGFVVGVLGPRVGEGQARAAVPPPDASDASSGAPLAPVPRREAARPRVPAGILARAADARALERAPACGAAARDHEPARCAPVERETIDIEWHVARDP
jgi:hypothetical protein